MDVGVVPVPLRRNLMKAFASALLAAGVLAGAPAQAVI
jgi:hypothetical protein